MSIGAIYYCAFSKSCSGHIRENNRVSACRRMRLSDPNLPHSLTRPVHKSIPRAQIDSLRAWINLHNRPAFVQSRIRRGDHRYKINLPVSLPFPPPPFFAPFLTLSPFLLIIASSARPLHRSTAVHCSVSRTKRVRYMNIPFVKNFRYSCG